MLGDVVRECAGADLDRVTEIIEPKTVQAEHFMCGETGGVFLENSGILIQPGTDIWEDLEFVSRAEPAQH